MQSTRIIAAVANVWRQPNNTSIDTPALANVGLQPWLAQLSDEDTVALERDNRIVTQALFNDVFLVEQFVNGWAFGYVVNQADSRLAGRWCVFLISPPPGIHRGIQDGYGRRNCRPSHCRFKLGR